mgnify:CR=1 FL=1
MEQNKAGRLGLSGPLKVQIQCLFLNGTSYASYSNQERVKKTLDSRILHKIEERVESLPQNGDPCLNVSESQPPLVLPVESILFLCKITLKRLKMAPPLTLYSQAH